MLIQTLQNTAKDLTCGDSEPRFVTDVLPGRVGHDTAVGSFILLGHLQNLEHPIRKGNEPVAHGVKRRRGGKELKEKKKIE